MDMKNFNLDEPAKHFAKIIADSLREKSHKSAENFITQVKAISAVGRQRQNIQWKFFQKELENLKLNNSDGLSDVLEAASAYGQWYAPSLRATEDETVQEILWAIDITFISHPALERGRSLITVHENADILSEKAKKMKTVADHIRDEFIAADKAITADENEENDKAYEKIHKEYNNINEALSVARYEARHARFKSHDATNATLFAWAELRKLSDVTTETRAKWFLELIGD